MGKFSHTQILVPVVIIITLIILILTGGKGTHDAEGRPTVVYAHPPCPPQLMESFEKAFADFRKKYPEINLKVLHITGNYEDKVKVMFAGKVAPDVIFMYPTALSAWVDLETLQPLDKYMEKDGKVTRDDYFKAGIETFTKDGKLYGIPKDASADILFYNKDLFRKKGIDFPNENWTWDDFLAAAKKITEDTDGDGRIDIYGSETLPWDRMVIQNGGKVISDDGTQCMLGEPQAVEALKYWSDLRTKHKVVPTPESKMDTSVWRMFALQRLGMFQSMYPGVSILRRTCEFEWDIAIPPKGPKKHYSVFVGSAFAISRQSKNPEAAYTFIRWLTSEGMRHVMTFDIPSYKKLGESDEWRDSRPPQSKEIAIEVMQYAGPPAVKHPSYQEIYDAIDPELNRVSLGLSDVDEAVKQIVPRVNKILDRYENKRKDKKK